MDIFEIWYYVDSLILLAYSRSAKNVTEYDFFFLPSVCKYSVIDEHE